MNKNVFGLLIVLVFSVFGLSFDASAATSPKNNNFFQELRDRPLDGGLTTGLMPVTIPAVASSTGGELVLVPNSTKTLHTESGPGVRIQVVPILAPFIGSGQWTPILEAEADILAGKPGLHSSYVLADKYVGWRNLIVNTVGETPWLVVIQIVTVESVDGSNSICLSMLRFSADSQGGGLDDNFRITGSGYSASAFGIKADGTLVTSGSQDTMVARIGMATQMPLFAGNQTQAKINDIRAWVLGKTPEFHINYRVTVEGHSGVGVGSVTAERPGLSINHDSITFTGDEADRPYELYGADSPSGPWKVITVVYGGDKVPIDTTKGSRFFRASGR